MGSFITLLYHEIVAPGTDPTEGKAIVVQQDYQDILPPILFVDGDNFAGQMEYLVQNKWHVLNIQEVLDFYLRGQGIPEKSVFLIFDDLWSGVWDFAAPVLRDMGFSALRVNVGIALSVLFFAENFATEWGIGSFIMNSWSLMRYTEMFAGILALSFLGMVLFILIDVMEKKLVPWQNFS